MKLSKYNRPALFYGVAILVPWIFWFTWAWLSYSLWADEPGIIFLGSMLGLSGLCVPLVIAMILILPDREMRRELWASMLNFRGIKPRYWVLTFVLFPVSILLAQAVSLLCGHSVEQFYFVEHMSFTAGIFPAWFLLILAPILEEFGWHTYGIHSLRNRFHLFTTCIIFGVVWGIWHMPLSFVNGYYQNVLAEEGIIYSVNFLVSLIPYVLISNWLYYKTNRNMFLVVVFHLLAGFSNEVFQTHPDSKVIQTGLLLVLAVVIICKERRFFFDRSEAQIDGLRKISNFHN